MMSSVSFHAGTAMAVPRGAIAASIGAIAERKLSPEAQKVAAEPVHAAYSPIVLAGFVRIIDYATIAVIGIAIYVLHVFPTCGFA